jgi:NADH-quinone oxidoreductase subunit A
LDLTALKVFFAPHFKIEIMILAEVSSMPDLQAYLPSDFQPFFVQLALALAFVVITMLVTHSIGPKNRGRVKDEQWECGIESVGDARAPISVKYFLVAILFVLFDVEIIFMYPWAVNFRQLGLAGFAEMILFMGILLAGFYYILKKGVLNWD